MSINFEEPMSDEARALMKELFGEPDVEDDRHALFSKRLTMVQQDMSKLANVAKQPVTVEVHELGEVKTMSDGTRYKVTPGGWVKLPQAIQGE